MVTSRKVSGLTELVEKYGSAVLPLELDITNRAACFAALEKANSHFGRVDVVINNAAMGVIGMVEELGEQESRNLIEANLFGSLWVTQAALPILRAQGSGHILQLSSALGVYTFPSLGIYSASKFAVEGFSEALYLETKGMGIHVTIVEPNGFATEFSASTIQSKPIAAYDGVRAELNSNPAIIESDAYGDPQATSIAILKLVDATEPPLRLFLGKKALPLAQAVYQQRLASWQEWNAVAIAAHGL
ncbi:SDR family NAD(P)-dependent oxidoreductase [Spirosoma soli]|uniref:SDR family NAD(P)-dependent oxidoreductase n=1 Tax=Spirosoma soli TaxID=1770529 RepID=A0ABW5M5H7_9BACT